MKVASLIFGAALAIGSCSKEVPTEAELRLRATALAESLIVVDTHIDIPDRLSQRMEDISVRTSGGDFDYPRAKEGGLDAAFMSIYVPAGLEKSGGSKKLADSLISMVEGFWRKWPDKFAQAYSVKQVRDNAAKRLLSVPMGMENGSPIEGKMENLAHFYNRGIRYITLAHSRSNHISDSSYDEERKWNGLSPFGEEVVAEMNRLGIMVDVSHVSDSAFYDVLDRTRAPVIASHSSCRFFTPGFERNMSDDMIRRLASNGGVIQINFGSAFLSDDLQKKWDKGWDEIGKYLDEHKLGWHDEAAQPYIREYREKHGINYADITDVVAHVDHVARLVGPAHVGFGSDFDGVGDSLPTGLKDVSMYPNLIYELMKKGYSEKDIAGICGENLLRVWAQVEATAVALQKEGK
jgi:membrane dipeptidase